MMNKKEIKYVNGVKGCCCVSAVLLHLLACFFVPAHNAAYKYLPNRRKFIPFFIVVENIFNNLCLLR